MPESLKPHQKFDKKTQKESNNTHTHKEIRKTATPQKNTKALKNTLLILCFFCVLCVYCLNVSLECVKNNKPQKKTQQNIGKQFKKK